MNEGDLSSLTYKELQALAVRYRVPGNIKKHQLVRVLQAVQSGNATEVERILAELQQTRKKRINKIKRDKMNVMSTPIHSPNYAMSEDYYYPQQHPPYQWVGAEEEISSREEDPSQCPDYDEFQQILLRRIQRQYRSYPLAGNELAQIPSVVDLRMSAGSSILHQIPTAVNCARANIVVGPSSYDQPVTREGEHCFGEDTNGNNQVPILLKKMLEAPAGANLGQIASPDKASYRISSLEQRPNHSNDPMNDSDTLTAESEGDNDEFWDNNNPENNDDNYYFIVDNTKETLKVNEAQLQEKIVQDIDQLPSNFLTNSTNQYQSAGTITDVQTNCQKWIATNSFVNKDMNYPENLTENSASYNPVYHDNTSDNSRMTKPRNIDQAHQNNGTHGNINYEANQPSVHSQAVNEAYQYYQINSETADASVNPNDAYYSQQMAKRVGDLTQKYFMQGCSNNLHTNVGHNDIQAAATQEASVGQFSGNPYNRESGDLFNPSENNSLQYSNVEYYSQYPNEDNQPLAGYPNAVQHQQQQYQYQQHQHHHHHPQQQQEYQQQQQQQYQQQLQLQQYQHQTPYHPYQQHQTNVPAVQQLVDRKNLEQQPISQSSSNGPLDSFWPRWPIDSTVTSNRQLEPIWHLRNYNFCDDTKMHQTSCVYCYTDPVVTQRIGSPNSSCMQKKRLRAECRQHSFRPTQLVYNDSSTGMTLSNASNMISASQGCPPELLNDIPSTSSMDLDSENMASTESSDNSINDVWIHDYTRYPSSSDYAPQSNSLIIDENDNDLFSL